MTFATKAPLLPDILALHGKWRAPDLAVVAPEGSWTWGEFTARIHRFAHGLLAQGVKSGDRVGLLMSNGLPMVEAIFGTVAMGGVVVPLNVSVSDDAAVAMFDDAAVSAVVACDVWRSRLALISARLNTAPLKISAQSAADGWLSLDTLVAGQATDRPAVDIQPGDLINIIYSSGTTGMPKGITHDHAGRRDWAYDLAIALRYHGGARTLLTIGLYSNISWVAMLATLLAGGCIFVEAKFSEQAFLDRVEADSITHTAMVPIQFQRVVEAAAQRPSLDLSSMQAMMSCGSPLRETLKRDIFRTFDCGVIELYGLTEGIITTLETEHAEGRWASVGRPLLGTDICVVDDEDRVLGANQSGEICSRGRIAMPGYWRRSEADLAATFCDAKGDVWLRSGDIGYVDEAGFLYIVDRKKDMILSGGQNIYPQDIEAVVSQHPAVFDVAVIGLPSQRWGETPVALVVLREGRSDDPQALLDWVNTRVGKQQRLADVILTHELPRNPNGKILKRELRQTYGERSYG